ncbi:MAG: hypothetical protein II186_03730, partial [Erysipelotrichales bacterium]|nr:hypothetical protein [Erysipelotrichales bacterium]
MGLLKSIANATVSQFDPTNIGIVTGSFWSKTSPVTYNGAGYSIHYSHEEDSMSESDYKTLIIKSIDKREEVMRFTHEDVEFACICSSSAYVFNKNNKLELGSIIKYRVALKNGISMIIT